MQPSQAKGAFTKASATPSRRQNNATSSAVPMQGEAKRAYRQVGESTMSTVAGHLSGDESWVVFEGMPAAQHRLEEPSRPM